MAEIKELDFTASFSHGCKDLLDDARQTFETDIES